MGEYRVGQVWAWADGGRHATGDPTHWLRITGFHHRSGYPLGRRVKPAYPGDDHEYAIYPGQPYVLIHTGQRDGATKAAPIQARETLEARRGR